MSDKQMGKEFDYVPKVVDEDGNPVFEGHVRIRVLNLEERLNVTKTVKLKMDANGNYDLNDNVDVLKRMIAVAKENIISVHLKMNDQEFNSMDDLEYFAEGLMVFQEIGGIMVNGFSLGKRLKTTSPNS